MLRPLTRLSSADLARYRARFVNRADVFARQWDNGQGWSLVAAPLTDDVLRQHLRGALTIGFYTPDLEGRTRWVCIDFDTDDGLDRGRALQRHLAAGSVPSLVEQSAGGRCHVWLFFDRSLSAAPLRRSVVAILEQLGWPTEPGVVEVFPKHDSIDPDAYGALMRAPLGRHRKAGGAVFPVVRLAEHGRYYRGGLRTLLQCASADPLRLQALAPAAAAVAARPADRSAPSRQRSELTEAIYARITVGELLAEKGIPVNRSGKARCPFHDDQNPSLQDYGARFHCFGCGARGDVITLYQALHRLPNRWRAREELAERLGIEPDLWRPVGRHPPGALPRHFSTEPKRPRVIQLSFWKDLRSA